MNTKNLESNSLEFEYITNQVKVLEYDLKKANEAIAAANQAKADSIANLSHDIRTPLTGIVGMSELLEQSLENPEHKEYAHWLYKSSKQLLGMLNGALGGVSTEQEHYIKQETFDLFQCIDSIVQLELPTIKLNNVELNIDIDNTVPHYIICDYTKIHRILLNLVSNAIKFTPKGQVTIKVKCLHRQENQVTLQFEVTDTGIGIPQDLLDKVFNRFFRSNTTAEGIHSGHGIGLHIVQSYITQLGGQIQVTSQEGKGTSFCFDLPCTLGKENDVSHRDNNKVQAIKPAVLINNVHILLIEDNLTALKMIEIIAAKAGYQYTSAVNGMQALDLAQTLSFDLIIADIGLPGISGHEFTKKLRAWELEHKKNPVPIVGLTAHAREAVEEKSLECGMNGIFTKPITLTMIQNIVDGFLAEAGPATRIST